MEEKKCCGGSCGCGSKSGGFFPQCPKCDGTLLPFSYKEDVFEKWKCSKCEHTIQKR